MLKVKYGFFVLPTQILYFFMQTVFYEATTRSRKAGPTKMHLLKFLDEDINLKKIKTRDKVLWNTWNLKNY